MANPTGPLSDLSTIKLALMAKQARAQLGMLTRADPIAVIGMGCRFPGGVDSPDAYWSLLRDGVDAVGEMPRDRWDVDAVYDPDPAAPGKMSTTQGGFLDRVDLFDAAFFGLLRREAERMDPQHRIFLEVAIDALDRAGLSRERLAGSATGVFIASYYNDYTFLQFGDREAIDARTLTGTQHSVLANRLSYLLDLRGPSISIDTACSSSLVAVHLACQSLRAGESDVAVAGGVSLMLAPEIMITLSKVGFMSASGRCRTFDAQADGFIRGEGCGVVVLKRLSDAISDNDRVLAVIRGSAVNQDGRSTVLAAPNGLAQQALVREALANAQLTPDRVGFIETHGTATPLGDPIEVEALAATIGAPRPDGGVCYLGSAKANLGHLEAASGVAGLIKATLVLQHREIPGQVHFTRLNPHLSLAGTCLAVADRHREWASGARPRVAGVSGFGVGGTNAHVLIEEAPALPPVSADAVDEPQLLALSAQSPDALRALATRWLSFLPATPEPLSAVASTAARRRSHYDHRLALVGQSIDDVTTRLQAFVDGAPAAVAVGRRPQGGAPRVAFVFSGQGPQWAQMGRELAAREPVFRDTLADLDGRFSRLAGWSLAEAIGEPTESSRLQDTELAQPAIFAIQVALASLWDAWGIRPDAVVGHSIGELAALYVAGVLSLDAAVRIVWHRGRIMQRATGLGRMAAVSLNASEAESIVRDVGPELSLAAVNGPRNVVLAGSQAALDAALLMLDGRGVSHRALPVSYAFHSAQMAPFQTELVAAIGSVAAQPGHTAVFSTVTGAAIDHKHIDAAYFGRNVRQTVRFADAIDAMLDTHIDAFVEVAPHPVLAAALAECLESRALTVPVLASMRRGRDERETMLQACAGLYVAGRTPRWESLTSPIAAPVELPSYPWQRERFWLREIEAVASRATARTIEGRWPSNDLAWLADHEVAGRTVMPAATMLELLCAAAQPESGAAVTLEDFVVQQPLVLDDGTAWTTVISREGDEPRIELRAWSDAEDRGETGALMASARIGASTVVDAPLAMPSTGEWLGDVDSLYRSFVDRGVKFGPSFRVIEQWRVGHDAAEGWLACVADGGAIASHSTLLDAAFQLCLLASNPTPGMLLLPVAVERFTLHRPLRGRLRAQALISQQGASGSVAASVRLFSEDEHLVASLEGVRLARADSSSLAGVGAYEVRWLPADSPERLVESGEAAGGWIVFTNGDEASRSLVTALTAAGGRCLSVHPGSSTGRDGSAGWTIAASDPGAMQACLADATWRKGLPLRGIVHAWSLEDASSPGTGDDADWLTSGSALALVQAIGRLMMTGTHLWLVTRGAQPATGPVVNPRQASLWGFANVVAPEYPDLPCHVVDLGPLCAKDDGAALLRECVSHTTTTRVALRGGTRYIPRLYPYVAPQVDTASRPFPATARLVVAHPGTIDGLAWQSAAAPAPQDGEVRLRVLAAGVNFRDVLLTLGMYPDAGATLGAECAGVVESVGSGVTTLKAGEVVFGFAPGSLGTEVTVPARFLVPVPGSLRVEDAAGLPTAFLTAMYGLQHVARIERGTRVLIHAAAGGVGLAAVQIAQRRGAQVFATAGSHAKRELVRSLGVQHVFDSRSVGFAEEVLDATGGAGVDVVLNSLAGPFIEAGVRALGRGGWFLELGKRDSWTPEQMATARPDVRYRAYDLGAEAAADRSLVGSMLHELCAALAEGTLRPLPVRTFDFQQAPDAFRFMAQARHVGKLVLRAPGGGDSRPLVRPDATYWITGGLGALGIRTARWLVASGARHIVLSGRHAPADETQRIIDDCVAAGALVHVRLADAGDRSAMTAIRDDIARTMPPLRGVVHAAGIVDDGMLVHQTWERWRAVLHGKAGGARVLDTITRDLPLDFFVLYSSAGVLLGPVGQGAYAAANAELDGIASARPHGLPALSIAWGQWRDSGMAARMAAKGHDPWSARGLGWMAERDAFDRLERLLADGVRVAAVLPINWRRFLAQLPAGIDAEFYRAVAPAQPAAKPPSARRGAPGSSVVDRWKATPAGERRGAMVAYLADTARFVIGLEATAPIDERTALKDVGLDSLMAVELRNVLTRALGAPLPATLLFDYPSLDALVIYLTDTLQLKPIPARNEAPSPGREAVDAVAALTDAEAEALLLAELDRGSMAGGQ